MNEIIFCMRSPFTPPPPITSCRTDAEGRNTSPKAVLLKGQSIETMPLLIFSLMLTIVQLLVTSEIIAVFLTQNFTPIIRPMQRNGVDSNNGLRMATATDRFHSFCFSEFVFILDFV